MKGVDPDCELEGGHEGRGGEHELHHEPVLGVVDVELRGGDGCELAVDVDPEEGVADAAVRGQDRGRHQTHRHALVDHLVGQHVPSQGYGGGSV